MDSMRKASPSGPLPAGSRTAGAHAQDGPGGHRMAVPLQRDMVDVEALERSLGAPR